MSVQKVLCVLFSCDNSTNSVSSLGTCVSLIAYYTFWDALNHLWNSRGNTITIWRYYIIKPNSYWKRALQPTGNQQRSHLSEFDSHEAFSFELPFLNILLNGTRVTPEHFFQLMVEGNLLIILPLKLFCKLGALALSEPLTSIKRHRVCHFVIWSYLISHTVGTIIIRGKNAGWNGERCRWGSQPFPQPQVWLEDFHVLKCDFKVNDDVFLMMVIFM